MVNVTEALFIRYMSYDCPIAHPELVPGADAGALQANNSFVPGTPNAGIDAVWGREAENLHNQPVQLKFRNYGFKRLDTGTVILSSSLLHSDSPPQATSQHHSRSVV